MMRNNFRLFAALIKNDKFRTSFLKYFAGAVSTALVAFAVYGVIAYSMYEMYLRDALSRLREQNLHQTSEFVDYIFDSVEQAMHLITNGDEIIEVLTAPADALPNARPADAPPPDGDDRVLMWSDIAGARDIIFNATVLSPALDSIFVASEINGHVLSWTEFRPLETFHDLEFQTIRGQGFTFYARARQPGQTEPDVITVIRDVVIEGELIAVAVFNIKYSLFASHVSLNFDYMPEMICLADTGGHIFYATDMDILNTDVRNHSVFSKPFAEAEQGGSGVGFEGGRVATSVKSLNGQYMIMSVMEDVWITNFRRNFTGVVLWGSLIGMLAAFFLAFGISFTHYRKMVRLVTSIGAPASPDDEAGGEINYIAQSITGLTGRDKHIEYELAEKLAELKKAQAIALQNQINPHFILNTLQIVNLDILSSTKADTDATRIISLLSEILKSNLNTTEHIVPLSYEVRQAAKYVEIERIRSKAGFRVDWDVDPELTDCRTVKFIIQPVLENCVKHGLTNSPNPVKAMTIKARREKRDLVLVISDNGLGMEPDVLDDIQARLQQSYIQENRHIGLCNVDKRIKLVFGDSYGVSITSAPGRGTVVVIRQKLVRGDWS